MAATPQITIKGLSVTYFPGKSNEVKALQNINLEIFPGEYIIFFGPSGCGKSTLLYSIAGLERNITGDIIVDGKNLATMKQAELETYHQTKLGMIFQSYYLIASLSIAENVALPQMGVSGAKIERTEKAISLLKKFGVDAQAGKLPTELSGGQQQRVAICRSLMNDPEILVADEPVGNLDSKSSRDVMDLLRYLNDEQKKTVILVTHDPSHLHHANRVFYLRDGQITGTKTNTPEERRRSLVEAAANPSLSEALSHWAKTLMTDTKDGEGADLATRLKARDVLSKVLTGMAVDEVAALEDKVGTLLAGKSHPKEGITAYLRKPLRRGGIGMAAGKARRLAAQIQKIIRQIGQLKRRTPALADSKASDDLTLTQLEAQEIRKILFRSLHIRLPKGDHLAVVDQIIRMRLEAKIDRAGVQRTLGLSLRRGGAGIALRDARRLSQQLEPFISNPTSPPSDETAVAPASPAESAVMPPAGAAAPAAETPKKHPKKSLKHPQQQAGTAGPKAAMTDTDSTPPAP